MLILQFLMAQRQQSFPTTKFETKKTKIYIFYAHDHSTAHARDQRNRITDKQSECSIHQGTKLAILKKNNDWKKRTTTKNFNKKTKIGIAFCVKREGGEGRRMSLLILKNGANCWVFKTGLPLEFSVDSVCVLFFLVLPSRCFADSTKTN